MGIQNICNVNGCIAIPRRQIPAINIVSNPLNHSCLGFGAQFRQCFFVCIDKHIRVGIEYNSIKPAIQVLAASLQIGCENHHKFICLTAGSHDLPDSRSKFRGIKITRLTQSQRQIVWSNKYPINPLNRYNLFNIIQASTRLTLGDHQYFPITAFKISVDICGGPIITIGRCSCQG